MKRKDGARLPFKRHHKYENIKEASEGLPGSPERVKHFAKIRLKAQELGQKLRKEQLER